MAKVNVYAFESFRKIPVEGCVSVGLKPACIVTVDTTTKFHILVSLCPKNHHHHHHHIRKHTRQRVRNGERKRFYHPVNILSFWWRSSVGKHLAVPTVQICLLVKQLLLFDIVLGSWMQLWLGTETWSWVARETSYNHGYIYLFIFFNPTWPPFLQSVPLASHDRIHRSWLHAPFASIISVSLSWPLCSSTESQQFWPHFLFGVHSPAAHDCSSRKRKLSDIKLSVFLVSLLSAPLSFVAYLWSLCHAAFKRRGSEVSVFCRRRRRRPRRTPSAQL